MEKKVTNKAQVKFVKAQPRWIKEARASWFKFQRKHLIVYGD